MNLEADLLLLLRPATAAVLSGIIGWEREAAGKAAGLRTHMLVGLAAALFIVASEVLVERYVSAGIPDVLRLDPTRVIEAVATGVGFLGAGTIFVSRREGGVHGLTTAASIWATAAIGVIIGLERYALAVGVTLLAVTILRALQRFDPDHPDP